MKFTVETISGSSEEEVLIRCHNPEEPWVDAIHAVAAGETKIAGSADEKTYRLSLRDGMHGGAQAPAALTRRNRALTLGVFVRHLIRRAQKPESSCKFSRTFI